MSRAVAVFRVTRRWIAVRVRVLPTVADVDRAYNGGRASRGKVGVWAFIDEHERHARTAHMVLPLDRWSPGLIAHECRHVVAGFHLDERGDLEEVEATLIGELTDSIYKRMRALEQRCA